MNTRRKLKLGPLDLNDPYSVRIYEITGKTINRVIEHVEGKIRELSLAMKRIAGDMSFLIEIEEIPEGEER